MVIERVGMDGVGGLLWGPKTMLIERNLFILYKATIFAIFFFLAYSDWLWEGRVCLRVRTRVSPPVATCFFWNKCSTAVPLQRYMCVHTKFSTVFFWSCQKVKRGMLYGTIKNPFVYKIYFCHDYKKFLVRMCIRSRTKVLSSWLIENYGHCE